MHNNLIALYGVTNVGKTTQIKLFAERCEREHVLCHTLKYPLYDLAPTGPLITEAIKQSNPKNLTAAEIQALMAKNRFDFQPKLQELMKQCNIVFAEMYTDTGIAYGIGDGVNKAVLLAINEGLIIPRLSILLDGTRFLESVEKGHRFEEDINKTSYIRHIHLQLAHEKNWSIVTADQSKEKVHEEIWYIVTQAFAL